MHKRQPPQENVDIFALLYCIETALRELIIDILGTLEGTRWYKKCLPGDILEKYRKGREFEKSIRWTQCIPHHPIYYIDFPDLRKIIERDDNWKRAFEPIFSRKDILSSALAELEPIRNKIAHNRKATNQDKEIVKGICTMLSNAIGDAYFDDLSNRCTSGVDIFDRLLQLQKEAENSFRTCRELGVLEKLKNWDSVRNMWWFDESYLGETLNGIVEFFLVVDEYLHLPRERGSGHKIEAWVRNSGIEKKYVVAQEQLSAIFANGGFSQWS